MPGVGIIYSGVDNCDEGYAGYIAHVVVDDELEVSDIDQGQVPRVEISCTRLGVFGD